MENENKNTETSQEIPSSIFPGNDVEKVNKHHQMFNTWFLIGTLIVIFFLLKKFIYIPDDKRHGK